MLIGYSLNAASSNGGIFFNGNEPEGTLCPNCGTCLNYDYHPDVIEIHPSRKYDVSYTHDLRKLFSESFVRFCVDELRCDDEFKKNKMW